MERRRETWTRKFGSCCVALVEEDGEEEGGENVAIKEARTI